MDDREAREQVEEVEQVLERIQANPQALEAVQALVNLYGEALRRVAAGADPVEDELLSHLLLVHDLDPGDDEVRVRSESRGSSAT